MSIEELKLFAAWLDHEGWLRTNSLTTAEHLVKQWMQTKDEESNQ